MAASNSWIEFVDGLGKSDLSKTDADALQEMYHSLRYVYYLTDMMGLYLWKASVAQTSFIQWLKDNRRYFVVAFLVYYCIFAEIVYLLLLIIRNPSAEAVIPVVSMFGFALLAGVKLTLMRAFRDRFKGVIAELGEMWPRAPLSEEEEEIKATSLFRLTWFHRFYMVTSLAAVGAFNALPMIVRVIHKALGLEAKKEFPFFLWYPLDKTQPVKYELLYIFEAITASHVVLSTVGTNVLFSGMTNHVCLLLKMLHIKLVNSSGPCTDEDCSEMFRSDEILADCVKMHQRLIQFIGDIENAFSVILFANVSVISINICSAGFTILSADIFVAVPMFLYLLSNLMEMGILCWYGDNVMSESRSVGEAIYFSQWYNTDLSARKTQALIMARAQVPLKLTALKFKDITLESYSSMICTSYSYFTLLCNMYRD